MDLPSRLGVAEETVLGWPSPRQYSYVYLAFLASTLFIAKDL
jgi:hypothetical protein